MLWQLCLGPKGCGKGARYDGARLRRAPWPRARLFCLGLVAQEGSPETETKNTAARHTETSGLPGTPAPRAWYTTLEPALRTRAGSWCSGPPARLSYQLRTAKSMARVAQCGDGESMGPAPLGARRRRAPPSGRPGTEKQNREADLACLSGGNTRPSQQLSRALRSGHGTCLSRRRRRCRRHCPSSWMTPQPRG